jgi:hypothetical protein
MIVMVLAVVWVGFRVQSVIEDFFKELVSTMKKAINRVIGVVSGTALA